MKMQDEIVEIREIQKEILYESVKGDEIDEMVADYINSERITDIVIKRVKEGHYQIGSRTTSMKINNGRLAVLSGGGYTSFEEYLKNVMDKEINK